MAKETSINKLRRLIREHVRAEIALDWIGTEQDEEERQRIQSKASRAKTALDNHIKTLPETWSL